jgi:hypothetical protein
MFESKQVKLKVEGSRSEVNHIGSGLDGPKILRIQNTSINTNTSRLPKDVYGA